MGQDDSSIYTQKTTTVQMHIVTEVWHTLRVTKQRQIIEPHTDDTIPSPVALTVFCGIDSMVLSKQYA